MKKLIAAALLLATSATLMAAPRLNDTMREKQYRHDEALREKQDRYDEALRRKTMPAAVRTSAVTAGFKKRFG